MNSRERVKNIVARKPFDRPGFWLGNPHEETWEIYHTYFGTSSEEELRLKLGDDFRWIPAGTYVHPAGKNPMQVWDEEFTSGNPLDGCERPSDLDKFDWPDPDYLDFTDTIERLKNAGPFYRASGFWTPFYHNVMGLFGMENYLVYMYTNRELVHAVTDRICNYYYEANRRFFRQAGDLMDGFFFGNDFGTQLDLICGPDQFDEFIMPWFEKFTDLAHSFGCQVILHSCGSIYKVIDRLIDAGVDCLHPLQAKAASMDAETLAKDFGGRITFMGGIDTQDLLVNGTPRDVRADVRRVKDTLGPNLIVSPSHEALLPNVPPELVQAMADEAVAGKVKTGC